MSKTLYDRGDRVRARSITSEMPAVIVRGDLDGVPQEYGGRGPEPHVVIRPIYHVGSAREELGPEQTVPRRQVYGRLGERR
jgi:hypothetical protein